MLTQELWITWLGYVVVAAPLVWTLILGGASLANVRFQERTIHRCCQCVIITGLLATAGILGLMFLAGTRQESLVLGHWVSVPGYHFSAKLIFDRLSIPFVLLTLGLCGTISAFVSHYLHREPGYQRFFVLYAVFVSGMVLTSLAATIEMLLAGWELVGLSSAFLIAYFQERSGPVRNGLGVWIVYRVSDAALLVAAIVMHHLHGEGDFGQGMAGGAWPTGVTSISANHAFVLGLLLVVAAAGKSALLPFSEWLPRAMEGPTPSSAIFYGALSVHLGAFLLLRMSPLIDASPSISILVCLLGLATAVYAYVVGNVQSDIKSVLAFASLAQVGLIVTEIGLGFRYLALIHLLGNACLRTFQFLSAPSLLHEYHHGEDAGGAPPIPRVQARRLAPPHRIPLWLYRVALGRGFLDASLRRWAVTPFVSTFCWFNSVEKQWTGLLSGNGAGRSDRRSARQGVIQDLP